MNPSGARAEGVLLRTYADCVPCFFHQALEAARRSSDDPAVHERVLRSVAAAVSTMDLSKTPPEMGRTIHRVIRDISGEADPYREVKERFNNLALGHLPVLRRLVAESDAPFDTAVRLAIAGNIIDFGGARTVGEDDLIRSMRASLEAPIWGAAIEELLSAVEVASSILYVGDNAGEIVFDHVLIEQMPLERVTFAVRGAPILNDVTREDAVAVGLADVVRVVENGSDAPGTILTDCDPGFVRCFRESDLVVAKGQGNYETLSGEPGRIFFLLQVKCAVIARDLGCDVGEFVVREGGRRS